MADKPRHVMADLPAAALQDRIVTRCDRCLQVDDHPRCRIDDDPTQPDRLYHQDCHELIAPGGDCHARYPGVGELKGHDLVRHIVAVNTEQEG